ncbi:hypothetical protein [Methylomonas koyamae]|uniref:hypothetical protein n=1 Tax=Methylomonas koyamae TaxID=702114 RepID=UPI00112EA602|nr:hypothetical protein [Methylomonas koyamae]TPQ24903.1 hypothetical protein C2U68_17145 [Methylomonas koyamae]
MSETILIDTDQLRALFKYQRPADLERCLAKNGVKFLQGKDGPVTTAQALHAAMGLEQKQVEIEKIEL